MADRETLSGLLDIVLSVGGPVLWVAVGVILTIVAINLFPSMKQKPKPRKSLNLNYEETKSLKETTRKPRIVAYLSILLFFGGGGAWTFMAPLSSAAMAPGVVSPEGRRIVVQHLEGGVIDALHVREGDPVKKDELLATLAAVGSRSNRDALFKQRVALELEQAVWLAEETGQSTFTVPSEILGLAETSDEVAESIEAMRVFQGQRVNFRQAQRQILNGRSDELRQQIAGLESEKAALAEQQTILLDEIANLQELLDRGLTSRPQLSALEREEARISGQIERAASDQATFRESLQNLEVERRAIDLRSREEASQQLVVVRRQLNQIVSELESTEDQLSQTELRAPADGEVLRLHITSTGQVLRPGEPLLDLVPTEGMLLIEARIRPNDINDIAEGQLARVVLTAFRQRNLSPIDGRVRSVSVDSLTDPSSNETYFLAMIEVPEAGLQKASEMSDQNIRLSPGMPAQVMIITGERTLAEYLFTPFTSALRGSFLEG